MATGRLLLWDVRYLVIAVAMPIGLYLAGKLATALAGAPPAMMLVCLTAVLSHHVALSAARWLALLIVIWAGVLPLARAGQPAGRLRLTPDLDAWRAAATSPLAMPVLADGL